MTAAACGSVAGYAAHRRRSEATCQPCRDAKASYGRERDQRTGACAEKGCDRVVRARNWCGTHLSRVDRHGRPDLPGPPVADRFWRSVTLGPVPPFAPDLGECWPWTRAISSKGYGKFSPQRGQHFLAHRWSYEALIVAIPDDLQLDHLCRVKTCVNPWHLEPVTRAENLRREHEARRAAA